MAAIAKYGKPTLASLLPPSNEVISGKLAGEDIAAGDLCTITLAGVVMKRTGAAKPRGVASIDASSGEAVTLYRNVRVGYGKGLAQGVDVYASTSVAGGLDDDVEGATPIGFVVDGERIQFTGL